MMPFRSHLPRTIRELRAQQLEQAALEELVRGHITAAERLWNEAHALREAVA